MVPINYAAIIVATLVSITLGFLWYGPILGKPWMKIMGFSKTTPMKGAPPMWQSFVFMALGAFVTACTLSHAILFATAYLGTSGVMAGLSAGFWIWLGFFVPVDMSSRLWEGKPWTLFFINTGFHFVNLLLTGALLASWL